MFESVSSETVGLSIIQADLTNLKIEFVADLSLLVNMSLDGGSVLPSTIDLEEFGCRIFRFYVAQADQSSG